METTDMQTRDIILRLKRVKAARGLSCGRICAMVAEAGSSVSLSTVKRVFADGSEDRERTSFSSSVDGLFLVFSFRIRFVSRFMTAVITLHCKNLFAEGVKTSFSSLHLHVYAFLVYRHSL